MVSQSYISNNGYRGTCGRANRLHTTTDVAMAFGPVNDASMPEDACDVKSAQHFRQSTSQAMETLQQQEGEALDGMISCMALMRSLRCQDTSNGLAALATPSTKFGCASSASHKGDTNSNAAVEAFDVDRFFKVVELMKGSMELLHERNSVLRSICGQMMQDLQHYSEDNNKLEDEKAELMRLLQVQQDHSMILELAWRMGHLPPASGLAQEEFMTSEQLFLGHADVEHPSVQDPSPLDGWSVSGGDECVDPNTCLFLYEEPVSIPLPRFLEPICGAAPARYPYASDTLTASSASSSAFTLASRIPSPEASTSSTWTSGELVARAQELHEQLGRLQRTETLLLRPEPLGQAIPLTLDQHLPQARPANVSKETLDAVAEEVLALPVAAAAA